MGTEPDPSTFFESEAGFEFFGKSRTRSQIRYEWYDVYRMYVAEMGTELDSESNSRILKANSSWNPTKAKFC